MRPGAVLVAEDRTRFRVWAPSRSRVEVLLDGDRAEPMEPTGHGWFEAEVGGVGAGDAYRYRLDGDLALPDPASLHQPDGVHGPSRVVDLSHDWTADGFENPPLRDTILYELHVGTFTPEGTFDAAIDRLDHLVDTGITAVELMPVNQFPGERNWGYDGAYLYAAQASYGGPSGLQRFVDAAHARGLAVHLDVVYNHLGPEGNYLAQYGPYFTDRYRTPWGEAVNFDGPGSDHVRRFVIDNALTWITDFRIDGLRLDAIHAIFDRSAYHILDELADEVHARAAELGRVAHVIAESPLNDPRLLRSTEQGGMGLDGAWNDDYHHALHVALTGEDRHYYADYQDQPADLATAVGDGYVLAGRYSRYRGHRVGASSADLPRTALVVFAQNHDQVGNRPFGDRLVTLVDPPRARLAAGLTLLSPWVPLLFMGEEWGETNPFCYFVDHGDPELLEAVRRGRAEEFEGLFEGEGRSIPDPGDPDTMERARLSWERRDTSPHRERLALHTRLIAARRAHPSLTAPDPGAHRTQLDGSLLTLTGCEGDDATLACFNLADRDARLPAPEPGDGRVWRRVLDGASEAFGGGGETTGEVVTASEPIPLGPWGFALYASSQP